MSALTPKTFKSEVSSVGTFDSSFSQDQIKNEPMMFNCDLEYAHSAGGPVTRAFIDALPSEWKNCPAVFDSRVHMLMPGWYPAIPGWHHDDVPRAPIPVGQHFMTAGQPDYESPRYLSEHIMGLVNGEICPTQFAVGVCHMQAVPDGGLIYRQWSAEVDAAIESKKLALVEASSGILYHFDWQTFHTGTKARRNGWRWFGRVSRNTERTKTISNELRRQVQVYLEFPMEGW